MENSGEGRWMDGIIEMGRRPEIQQLIYGPSFPSPKSDAKLPYYPSSSRSSNLYQNGYFQDCPQVCGGEPGSYPTLPFTYPLVSIFAP